MKNLSAKMNKPANKALVASSLLLAMAASLAAQAQTQNENQNQAGQFDISPFAGYHTFENKQNLEDAFTYGIRLGYTITPNWAVEGAVSFVGTQVDDPTMINPSEGQFASPIDNVDLMLYQIDALYYFSPKNKFSPYIVAGYGAADYSPSISDKDMSTFNLGVGAKYWLKENLALRFDLRNHFVGEVVQETYHNLSATIGLTFVFGGESRSAQPVAAPVEQQPYVAPQAAVVEKEIVLEFDDIHFDFDQSTLTSEAKAILKDSVDTLKANPKAKVRIAGYTSAAGTVDYNQALSERRAVAIKNYLVEQGIATRRLSTIGYGDTRPETHESTPKNLESSAAKDNMRALFEIVVE